VGSIVTNLAWRSKKVVKFYNQRGTAEHNVLGVAHLAFEVRDISAIFAKMSAGDANIMNPPAQVAPGRIPCYLQDPDGNWLELMELNE
jgi:catechol 2,3-dioxygenase-like lactoylglutathione lyase family enzyme